MSFGRTSLFLAMIMCTTSALRAGELVPYQADHWRFKEVAVGDPLATSFVDPKFDDSSWLLGQGAFGNHGACALQGSVHTNWSLFTAMLLRRKFTADPTAPVVLHFTVDNDATVWVNGTLVANVSHENCPGLDDFNVTVPNGVVTSGANVLMIRAIDRGGESFVDIRLEGTPPPSSLPDLAVDGLSVCQAVTSEHLITGRRTVIRAKVQNLGGPLPSDALLKGILHVLDANGTQLFIRASTPSEGWKLGAANDATAVRDGSNTMNFVLEPSEVDRAQLRFWVEVDAEDVVAESNETNNSTADSPITHSFYTPGRIRSVYYTMSGDDAPFQQPAMGDAHRLMAKTYPIMFDPIADWQDGGHIKWSASRSWQLRAYLRLNRELAWLNSGRAAEQMPLYDRIVGFMDGLPDGSSGVNPGFGGVGSPVLLINAANPAAIGMTLAHEMGHTFGLRGEYYRRTTADESCPSVGPRGWRADDGYQWNGLDCTTSPFNCSNYPALDRDGPNGGCIVGRFVDEMAMDCSGTRPKSAAYGPRLWGQPITAVTCANPQLNSGKYSAWESATHPSDQSSSRRIGFMGGTDLGDDFAWITTDDYELLAAKLVTPAPIAIGTSGPGAVQAAVDQLWISAIVTASGTVEPVDWVRRVTGLPPDTPTGTGYSIDFIGAADSVLASHPFGLTFEDDTAAVDVRLPFPAETQRIELRKEGQPIFVRAVSGSAPSVMLTGPSGGTVVGPVSVTWSSSDPDGDALTSSLLFSPDGGNRWIPIAVGVTGGVYLWNTDGLAGTASGLLTVVVSDGVHTVESVGAAPFVIPAKLPTVTILTPADGDTVVAGQTLELRGQFRDPEDGPAGGAAMTWTSSLDGVVGTGATVSLGTLQPGLHTLQLHGTDTQSNPADAVAHIVVLSDGDHDGMPDDWEQRYPGLLSAVADGTQDQDQDGLTNRDEFLFGTNPISPDTDGDGTMDGVEIRLGSDPRSPGSIPLDVPERHPHAPLEAAVLNFPNPFSSSVMIRYSVPVGGRVRVAVYDVAGRRVATCVDGEVKAGTHYCRWDGRSAGQGQERAGVFFVRLETVRGRAVGRIVRVR